MLQIQLLEQEAITQISNDRDISRYIISLNINQMITL